MNTSIRLNWVVIIAGLIPLWAAIFIAFSNMKVLNADDISTETGVAAREPSNELQQDTPAPEKEEKILFKNIIGSFRKGKEEEQSVTDEFEFTEEPLTQQNPVIAGNVSMGIPKGIKKIWGVTMIFIFLACLAYGSERGLDYLFKEYRWVIGTTNPWTSQLASFSMFSTTLAGIGVMVASLKTGIYLIRN